MNKKFVIIALAIIAIFGSLVTFYASNMFFGDVANFGAGFMNTTLFVTLPMMLFGAILIAAPLFIIRFYQRPNSRKVLSRNYLFIAMQGTSKPLTVWSRPTFALWSPWPNSTKTKD